MKDPLLHSLADLVALIHGINHAWHRGQENKAPIELLERFRRRKDRLQIELLSRFPARCRLYVDPGAPGMLAIRLDPPVRGPRGGLLKDAAHVPIRMLPEHGLLPPSAASHPNPPIEAER